MLATEHNTCECQERPGDPEQLAGWILLVRSEYRESPGLSLTLRQASRLWNLDLDTRDAVLAALVASGFLRQTKNGMFVRADIAR